MIRCLHLTSEDPEFLTHFSDSAAAAAKSLQSCLTLCDPIDGSPPDSSVHGIFQARVLERAPLPSLSCSAAGGVFLDQGWKPCLLHWQAGSLPLSHQGSPWCSFFIRLFAFSMVNCVNCLYTFEINPLLVASFASVFSKSVRCLFVWWFLLLWRSF